MFETVRSADGTTLAYERSGAGPPLVLVGGAFNNRRSADAIVAPLAERFTVYAFDRRGRGDSTDTPPYAVAREIEDLAALIDAAGGHAFVYGHSSGAILSLEAAARGVPVTRLAVYEPPYVNDESRQPLSAEMRARVQAAIDRGDREEAAETFLREAVEVPAEVLTMMKQSPMWPAMLAVAHTLPYDLALTGDGSVPARLADIRVPTVAMDGGASPPWMRNAVARVAAAIPGARRVTVEGQDHAVAPRLLAPLLVDFFTT